MVVYWWQFGEERKTSVVWAAVEWNGGLVVVGVLVCIGIMRVRDVQRAGKAITSVAETFRAGASTLRDRAASVEVQIQQLEAERHQEGIAKLKEVLARIDERLIELHLTQVELEGERKQREAEEDFSDLHMIPVQIRVTNETMWLLMTRTYEESALRYLQREDEDAEAVATETEVDDPRSPS